MTTSTALPAQRTHPLAASLLAWGVTLAVSTLPDILFRELGGGLPGWVYTVKVGLLAAFLLIALAWKPLRGLWLYGAALLALYVVQWGAGQAFDGLGYRGWFAGAGPFVSEMLSVQIPRVAIGIVMVVILLALTRDARRFFFTFGERGAIAKPIPWIMTDPTPWKKLGPFLCGCLFFGMIAITWLMGTQPSPAQLAGALPYLPLALLFAFCNSFGEELCYRATLIAGLEGPLGAGQALALSAVYFGIGHFYGVPYGVIGVLLASFMGWLLGKAMLETRGFFWPWAIHVCLDTVVFAFIAVSAIKPGG